MQEFYRNRRKRLFELMDDGASLVVSSPTEKYRNADTTYPYRQSSDVLYLSGCPEPETTLVLKKDKDSMRSILFVRPKNKEREIWDGRRLGVEGAVNQLGFDEAYPSHELGKRLAECLSGSSTVYAQLGEDSGFDKKILSALKNCRQGKRKGLEPIKNISDPLFNLHEMRLIKSKDEIELLKKAATISSRAHVLAMQHAKAGVHEYEISALLDFEFTKQGCVGPGYQSIVGSGQNATILHYIENTSELKEGELLLIDAGGEYKNYTADITRTFPVSGTFSPAQKAAYQVVLRAQKEAIASVKPGMTLDSVHEQVVKSLTGGMIELGLLQGSVDERIADKSFRRFYMHKTSHWLGMDVHDVGLYHEKGSSRPLQAGMVITIEPGLYISEDEEGIPPEYKGIGIRIEDDILVTEQGFEVLTHEVPKEINEIEKLCRSDCNNLLS